MDDPTKPLVTCGTGDDAATKYLLSPAAIEGTDLKSASAGVAQGQVQWQVNLTLGGDGKQVFSDLSRAMAGSEKQFAVVLDGKVISAPTFDGVIPNGSAQITGNFTEDTANSLATSLKYGALPLAFEKGGTQVETVGPSLAGDQLSAGITAGIIGLLLVMIYCLIYYRGLGLVVIASLIVAGAVTYAMVLLLSKGAGFTLSLPGIAGLIVAVGITADSFIVYFERIRDEMRDGKSMRVAVQSGWKRARNTCLAADTVSLLAAVVLYIFAAGVVKGFAFALGLSTLIDLAIFFWFTHPMVVWLSRFRFFNRGHKLSGSTRRASASIASPWEGGPDGQVLASRQRPLLRSPVHRLRRPQVALVRPVRRHHRAGRRRALAQGPQHGHRVHRRRAVPRLDGLQPGDPGHRRQPARHGGGHGHRRCRVPGGDDLG